jgi:hypothetical protein
MWHGLACGLHFRRKPVLGSPVAETCSTHSTYFSTVRCPWSSNRTTKSPKDSNSQGKQGSLRKEAISKVIFDHPSLNLQTTHPAIPIIPAPVTQNQASPICPVVAAVPTKHRCGGIQSKSTKAEGNPAMHSLRQLRPLNLPLYQRLQVEPT